MMTTTDAGVAIACGCCGWCGDVVTMVAVVSDAAEASAAVEDADVDVVAALLTIRTD